jgi:SAM-dependent methyltransferase
MCNPACLDFAERVLPADLVRGRRVIEVGSMNVNGSVRAGLEALGPAKYVGVDLGEGPGVDQVCPADRLLERFGPKSFDLVVSTEMLEHVLDWRTAVENLKGLVADGGHLLITTRSRGFPYHEFPYDYWRYEQDDMRRIFADFTIEALEPDSFMPGVFMLARRDGARPVVDLSQVALYSIVAGARRTELTGLDRAVFRVRHPVEQFLKRIIPQRAKDFVKGLFAGRAA